MKVILLKWICLVSGCGRDFGLIGVLIFVLVDNNFIRCFVVFVVCIILV